MLYFGILKDLLGAAQAEVDLAEGAAVVDLMNQLRTHALAESPVWGSLAVAVNRQYATGSMLLHEGDEVALLPPVSGGSHAR